MSRVFLKILAVPNKQAFWSNEVLSSNPIFFTNALKFLLIVPSARMITGMTVTLLQFQIVHILLLIFFHFLLFLFKHSCDKGTSEIYYATRSLLLQFVVPDLAQQSAVLPSLSLCRYLFSTNPMKSGSHFLHPLQKLFVKFLISVSSQHFRSYTLLCHPFIQNVFISYSLKQPFTTRHNILE